MDLNLSWIARLDRNIEDDLVENYLEDLIRDKEILHEIEEERQIPSKSPSVLY